jgi:hypothetical protein
MNTMIDNDAILNILNNIRAQGNIYLGKQFHVASEQAGTYVYSSDTNDRLSTLQAIIGHHPINKTTPLSLWHLVKKPNLINKHNLHMFIDKLKELLKPIKHCRLKPDFKKLIEISLTQLEQACALLEKREVCALTVSLSRLAMNQTSSIRINTSESIFDASCTLFNTPRSHTEEVTNVDAVRQKKRVYIAC